MAEPYLPSDRRYDILCISSIDWDFIWQGHQEIMSTLAADGHRVLFLENTGVRPPRLRDLPRLRQRLRNWKKGTGGFREERPNLYVMSPIVLPLPYSRIARWINRGLLLHSLRRWMRAVDFARPLVWTFLPTPLAHDLIRELQPVLTVYYCIDDLASSSPEARKITSSEKEMFRSADLVFVTSEKLRLRAAELSQNVHFFPFGVRFGLFEDARATPRTAPEDVAGLRRPIIGYVGGLHQWVDQDLLVAAATQMPEATFVMVGPAQCDVTRLESCKNIVLLGARPHASLPSYIREFDVGIVPYRIAEYTSNVYPTKLNEYLAMGIPVVATDLAEIRRFNNDHGEIVRVAADAGSFVSQIGGALDDTGPEVMARRIQVARSNSWRSRIDRMLGLIAPAVAANARRAAGWDVRLKRAYRTARRRTVAIGAAVLISYLAIFETPLVWALASPLKVPAAPRAADVIVVFAGGVGESGEAGGGYQERVKQAADLYRQGLAPRMIFSSGFRFVFQEAESMRALAIADGVPASAILLETEAANTYQNVEYTRRMVEANGWKRVLLVSSPYHMRRAMMTWRKASPGTEVISAPVPVSQFYASQRGASFEQIRGLVQEYAATAVYWWRGWL
jgi:uncharacterized SAM-binding protein YcdF (DUF218 family)/glycosyltransferase involved in cell wall biosynthesis